MEISNADRVVFPEEGITKGDVAAYYRRVGDRLLPFLRRRALTVERFPKGIDGDGFMQKNAPEHYPADLIARHEVPKEGGGTTVYPVIDSAEAIEYFANQGVITFHVPTVRVDDEMHPDWIVWDLDPPEGRFDLVREAAPLLRGVLDAHGMTTALMTSGSKGYHLRARVERTITIDDAAVVARGTAALAVAAHPDLMTVEFRKADRGERVFVDWLRNSTRSTSVAPWSLRARPGAPVAAPITWDEVATVDPDGIRLTDIGEQLSEDPWGEIAEFDAAPAVAAVEESLATSGIVLEPFDRFRS